MLTFFTIAKPLNQQVAEVTTSAPPVDTDQLTAGDLSPAINDPPPSSGSGNIDAGVGASRKLLSHKERRKEKKGGKKTSVQEKGDAPARSGINTRDTQTASGVATSTGFELDVSVGKSEQGGDEDEGGHRETSRTRNVNQKESNRLLSDRKGTDTGGSKRKGPSGASKHHAGKEQYNVPPALVTAPSEGTDWLGQISTIIPPENIGEAHLEMLKPSIISRELSVLKVTPGPPFTATSQPASQSNTDTTVFSAVTVTSVSNTVVKGDAKSLHGRVNSAQGELCHIFLCPLIPITAVDKPNNDDARLSSGKPQFPVLYLALTSIQALDFDKPENVPRSSISNREQGSSSNPDRGSGESSITEAPVVQEGVATNVSTSGAADIVPLSCKHNRISSRNEVDLAIQPKRSAIQKIMRRLPPNHLPKARIGMNQKLPPARILC